MINQRVFHTYKEDFPIFSNGRFPPSFDVDTIDKKMTNLILELSDLADISKYVYITRHTNDQIPEKNLNPFINRFSDFVDYLGNDQPYNIPTIWFVCHFESSALIKNVQNQLDIRNIEYFEHGDQFESFDKMNETYCENDKDAPLFPKFLHQVTMIGIDLLKRSDVTELKQLQCLEWLQYRNVENMISDLNKMEQYLRKNSQFYQNNILMDSNEASIFRENFNKIKMTNSGDGRMQLYSWPHFLFNICGVSSTPTICD